MAFRRTTSLPCKISKKISLRLHPNTYSAIKNEADRRTLEEGKIVTIGDIIRENLDKDERFLHNIAVPPSHVNNPSSGEYHQIVMNFA